MLPPVHEIGSVGQSDLGPLAEIARTLIGEDGLMRGAGAAAGAPGPEGGARDDQRERLLGRLGLPGARPLPAGARGSRRRGGAELRGLPGQPLPARPRGGACPTVRRAVRQRPVGCASCSRAASCWTAASRANLQDPLAFRVVAQAHATARDALDHARGQVEVELRSAGDNPLRDLRGGAGDLGRQLRQRPGRRRPGLRPHRRGPRRDRLRRARPEAARRHAFSGLPDGLRVREDDPDDALAIVGHGAAALAAEVRLLAAPVSIELPDLGPRRAASRTG